MARQIGIRIFKGDELLEEKVFDRDIIKIGRLASAHLRLDDPQVSRIHAVIDITSGGKEVSIIDMGSAEGTRVNGDKISRVRLSHGDEVQLGDSRLEVLLEEAAVVAIGGVAAASADEATELVTEKREELKDLDLPDSESSVFETSPELQAELKDEGFTDQPTALYATEAPPPVGIAPPNMMAQPPPPDDPITPENRHLEITQKWGSDVVEVKRIKNVPEFYIGTADDCDAVVPLDGIGAGASKFQLIRQAPGSSDWHLRFTSGMSGTVEKNGEAVSLADAQAHPDGDAKALTIVDGMRVSLVIGAFTLEIQNVAKSRAIPIPPLLDMLFINTALVAMFAFSSMVSVLLLMPPNLNDMDDDLFSNPNDFKTIILKKPKKNNSFLDKLKKKSGASKAAKDKKGKMGKKKSKKTNQRAAAKKREKPSDEQVVSSKMKQLFGDTGSAGINAIFGPEKGGNELQSYLGNMSGARVGEASGSGGLHLRGSGPGGGGTGLATTGLGGIGTRGRGGSGEGGYGGGTGGLGQQGNRAVAVSTGTPIIYGALDKEIIRRIVRENSAAIKYCYERELTSTKGLQGKITMKWVIGGSGKVTQTSTAATTMNNKKVESCMARKIKGWRFPKPKGGGMVVVNYPFVFKKSG